MRKANPDNTPLLVALSGNLLRIGELRRESPFDHMLSKPADLDALLGVIGPALFEAKG